MPTSFKLLLGGIVLVVVGLFWAAGDIRMKISGRKATARITDASDMRGRTQVFYLFSDEQNVDRTGSFRVDNNWRPPADLKVDVVFLPGRPETVRLANDSSLTGIFILLGGIALTAFGAWYFKHESVVDAHRQTAEDLENATDPAKRLARATRGITRGLR